MPNYAKGAPSGSQGNIDEIPLDLEGQLIWIASAPWDKVESAWRSLVLDELACFTSEPGQLVQVAKLITAVHERYRRQSGLTHVIMRDLERARRAKECTNRDRYVKRVFETLGGVCDRRSAAIK